MLVMNNLTAAVPRKLGLDAKSLQVSEELTQKLT
jgi:hypothetical protein